MNLLAGEEGRPQAVPVLRPRRRPLQHARPPHGAAPGQGGHLRLQVLQVQEHQEAVPEEAHAGEAQGRHGERRQRGGLPVDVVFYMCENASFTRIFFVVVLFAFRKNSFFFVRVMLYVRPVCLAVVRKEITHTISRLFLGSRRDYFSVLIEVQIFVRNNCVHT